MKGTRLSCTHDLVIFLAGHHLVSSHSYAWEYDQTFTIVNPVFFRIGEYFYSHLSSMYLVVEVKIKSGNAVAITLGNLARGLEMGLVIHVAYFIAREHFVTFFCVFFASPASLKAKKTDRKPYLKIWP